MFGLNPADYPIDYNNLSSYQKELILDIYKKAARKDDVFYDFTDLMKTFNIFIENDWSGHYAPFLATNEDAEIQLETMYEHME